MEGKLDMFRGEEWVLCDYAYTNESAMKLHWWCGDEDIEKKFYKMPFIDYMQRHCNEIRGMNSFYEVGRLETLKLYAEKWEQEIVTARQKESNNG